MLKRQEALLIALLFALAVAQPLFSLLGDNAEFFVSNRFGVTQLIVFAIVLSICLPLLLIAVILAANKLHSGIGKTMSLITQFVLWSLVWLPVASRLGLSGTVNVGISAVTAMVCVAAWYRFNPVRLLLFYLSPAILLFPLFFLFASGASEIVVPKKTDLFQGIGGSGKKTDIVFIMFDEFPLMSLLTPELEIDGDRYPNFKRLANTSTWFRNATTPSEITTGALPAALSGLHPTDMLPIHSNFPQSLFTLLSSTHEITAWESATLLCPDRFCKNSAPEADIASEGVPAAKTFNLTFVSDLAVIYAHIVTPRPYSSQLPAVSQGWSGFLTDMDDSVLDESIVIQDADDLRNEVRKRQRPIHRGLVFEAFVEEILPANKPGLFFLHSMLPHSPWVFQPNGKEAIVESRLRHFGIRPQDDPLRTYAHEWYPDSFAVNQALQKALLQIQYVDVLLGQLLDSLDAQGLFDDTLLIVATDHGASFIPGQSRRSINDTTMSNVASIPLFVKFPRQKTGALDELPASLTDILPTVIDVLDLAPQWNLSGSSLAGKAGRKQQGGVQILDATGRMHEFRRGVYEAHLKASARELARTFGTGSDANLYKFGPYPRMVGLTPRDFREGAVADGHIITDATGYFRDINLEKTFYPIHVWGRWVDIPAEEFPKNVAVAVNGVIQSTTQTYRIAGYQDFFSAVIPGDIFIEGRNHLQFFAIEESGGELILREITQSNTDGLTG